MKIRGRRASVATILATAVIGVLVGAFAVQATVLLPQPKLTNLAKSESVRGAPGRELKLTRVDVPVAAKLPPHRHLGTQVSRVVKGTLTYTVIKGSVTVRRGAADGSEKIVRTIKAGQTGKVRTGQWIVEQPHVHHFARNLGPGPVVIYLATLFPKGAPASVPVPNP